MGQQSAKRSWSEKVLIVLAAFALLNAFVALAASGANPITYWHDFRQGQTALSAYWFLKNGFSLTYETPVLGAPWAVPFEFPSYQALAASVAWLGVPLDLAGRLVSWVFFISCLWPLRLLQRAAGLDDWWFWASSAMFLASPIYIFWGRSFMIETMALFFAMAHAALVVRFMQTGGIWRLLGAAVFGVLAVLTKATTLPAFSLLAGLGFCWLLWSWHALGQLHANKLRIGLGAVVLILPYPPGFAWVDFSDAVKAENPIGQFLTSKALSGWNYGTLESRFSADFWVNLLPQRMLPDILGHWATWLLLLALLVQVFPALNLGLTRARARLVAIAIIGFFTPLILFSNLHFVHNYYQASNAVFLIVALAIIASDMHDRGRTGLALAGVVLVVVSQLSTFYQDYFGGTKSPPRSDHYNIALVARDRTPENSALFVFGLDWNSIVPYYAERRAFAPPNWASPGVVANLVSRQEDTLGGLPLGGVIWCRYGTLGFVESVEQVLANMTEVAREGVCAFYMSDEPDVASGAVDTLD